MAETEQILRETVRAVQEVADLLEAASRGDTADLRGATLKAVERLRALGTLSAGAGDFPLPPPTGPRVA